MTNAQAAVIAAASLWANRGAAPRPRDVTATAAELQRWLDDRDEAQTQANIAASYGGTPPIPDDDRGLG